MEQTWMIFVLSLVAVATDAIGDVANDMGRKNDRHALQSVMVLCFLLLGLAYHHTRWIDHGFILLGMYLFNRWMWFDLVYNAFNPYVELSYVGSTSFYDRITSKWRDFILYRVEMPFFGYITVKLVIWIGYEGTILLGNYFKYTSSI